MQPTQWVTEGAGTPGPGAYYTPQQMSMANMRCCENYCAYINAETYLQDLRTSRPARPTGSRPPPAHFKTWSNRENTRVQDIPTVSSALQAAKAAEVMSDAPAPAATTPRLLRRELGHAGSDKGVEMTGEGSGATADKS